ncbi:PREDICTED: putative ATP-dependent RNA helicase TDRD9 isoform X1 [Lepidothrix coronata]|uniref:ATP-dependent RNA helicase TDRD9 n=1 Tax=Lepidothrix coronata TaxID=321398 RepID=A0A6J0GMI8_9PASS|nr:PREDICTED: putative ATP-dependent RNA helicase TDRD9 isoform X1 [Lepidothrix coronata]
MLRKLTPEQIRDWFTVGSAVTAVELLGEEAQAAPPCAGPRHPARASLTAAGLPITQSVGTEYAEKYRQAEEQQLGVSGNDQPVSNKPGASLSQCLSGDSTSIPIIKHKYVNMPTAKHREKILSLIQNNSVVIVEGATGSGKSTQIPQYVLDYCMQQSIHCNIAVTQPRKISASSLARWISKERSWTLGGFVGYQLSLENVSTKETRLLYMTTGILLQKVVSAKSLTEFTHIFIDEVHERTEEMDFLLLMTRKLLYTNSQSVKIILMSASINSKEFADYFAIPLCNGLNPVCVFKVEGKPFAVEEYYLDDLKDTVDFKLHSQSIEEPVIKKNMYDVAVSLIESFDEFEMKREENSLRDALERGSVLVFLPGLAEIRYMHSCLSDKFKRWQVYPLHSCVTLEEQNEVFLATVPGYRKIILATNIAESSITVPDVKYVIDFCLTKALVCDKETNYQSLRLCWASKTNCNQRKGRAGRVSRGYCYRLVCKDFWTNFIPEKSEPEILRCPLGGTVLKLKKLDMGEPKALLATALSPPNVDDIERTIVQLKELGALACMQTEEDLHDGELTFLGRVLIHLPVDLYLGKLVVLGHVFGCLEECLIIAAALSLRNFFVVPFKEHVDGFRKKMGFAGNSKSDCIAIVNAFKAWQACKQKGKLRDPKEEYEWGRSNCVHVKRMKEVAELFHNLKRRVRAFNMYVNAPPSTVDQEYVNKQRFILQVVIAGAFYPNYFTFGECNEKSAAKELAGKDPKTTVMLRNIPPYGYLYHKQLQSQLRQCGQVKSIAYNGSKALVEFSRNPKEAFKVLPEVYLAIKMLKMKIPFELDVHHPDDIRKQLQGVAAASLESLRVNVDCQKQTVEPVEISFGALEMSMIPSRFLCIKITEIVEVGHFWGYRIDEKNRTVLEALTAEINYQNLMDLSVPPRPDLLCLAPFAYLENRGYYRACVLYVHGDFAEVFFVDYGNRSEVPLNKLKEIPSCLQGIPFQALEFKICKMRPSARSIVCGERWSYSASQRFASLVDGCSLLVHVYSVVHGVLHVDVFRYSRCKDLVNIRDVLIEERYAELAEESYESQQSHNLLKELLLDEVKKEKQVPVSSRQEEKHLIGRLLNCFSDNKSDAPTHKVTVSGPFSPYELKCYSLTRVSRFRNIFICKESINSVVVHDTAEDPFQQLLVAADISVNAAGSTLFLGETSLMPPIPGLLALLSMLFAPAIELRVDKTGKYFTGVLCGLGWSRTSGAPLLPENDMALTFDVQFGMEDIIEINNLRTSINKLLCERAVYSGQEQMIQLQENIRQKLLCLICKSRPRDKIVPTWCENQYAWNQVDSQRIVDKSEKQHERGNSVYQLHKLVLLND